MASRVWIVLLLLSACDFAPGALPPVQVHVGEACAADAECVSGVCTGHVCLECRTAATCGAGRTCTATGHCADPVVPPATARIHVPAAGLRSTNGGRVHVGRVAVIPVSSSEVVR